MTDAAEPRASLPLTGDQQRTLRWAGGALAVLGAGSLLGVASSLYLVNHAPLLLVALSPIGRHLLLAAPVTDPVAFVAVASVRRLLFYTACFYLGRSLGDAALVWIEARAGRFAGYVRWLEGVFSRHATLVVLIGSGPTVSTLAGISGMSARRFLLLSLPGLLIRMVVYVQLGEWLREPLEVLLAWIARYWIPGTIAIVVALVVHRARSSAGLRRRPAP